MNIKITVRNYFTKETLINSTVELNESSDWAIVEANHKAFSQMYPDCYVNFMEVDGEGFIFGMPYNQSQDEIAYDEGRMTWQQYCDKWYKGSPIGGNEEDSNDDAMVEQMIMDFEEEDWNRRDAICY